MYGLALPLLFPIALLSMFVIYTVEKLMLTYFYRKPPMFDEKMNTAAISVLKWAPFFLVAFNFWSFSNKQIFSNVVLPKMYSDEPIVTDHNLTLQGDQSLPLFIFAVIFFFCIFFNDLLFSILNKIGICAKAKEDEVDE